MTEKIVDLDEQRRAALAIEVRTVAKRQDEFQQQQLRCRHCCRCRVLKHFRHEPTSIVGCKLTPQPPLSDSNKLGHSTKMQGTSLEAKTGKKGFEWETITTAAVGSSLIGKKKTEHSHRLFQTPPNGRLGFEWETITTAAVSSSLLGRTRPCTVHVFPDQKEPLERETATVAVSSSLTLSEHSSPRFFS